LTEILGPPRLAIRDREYPARPGRCYHRGGMDTTAPALQQFLVEFKRVSNAIVDSYFVVDTDRRIVDFNRAFHALLPRSVARGLKGKHCFEVLELNICANECIARQCWRDNRHVRLDEISGNIAGESQRLRFILSAVPITDAQGNQVGALEIQRNVTDEAVVQVKYQEMLEKEARERERLANQVRMRTKELLETNQLLLKTQKELLAYKKGLTV
jgi:PAS domain-containing protein